mmetsp:Transcript_42075/g.64506  ORF Transcript_42075/g.64506 Transcript_42075/m.64506 type:complete len:364 (-) Transcript_42075:16-1107(-)
MSAAEALELLSEADSHRVHSGGHVHQGLMPRSSQVLVSENHIDESSTVDGRAGVGRSSNLLYSGAHSLGLGGIGSNEVDASSSLTVKAEVLGKGLEHSNSIVVVGEVSQRERVLVEVTGGEALVGVIEGTEVTLPLAHLEDLLPVVLSGVAASGVVGTGVEEDDLLSGSLVEILEHAVDVEDSLVGVVVSVLSPVKAGSVSDTLVSRPGRGGNPDLRRLVGEEFMHEIEEKADRSSSRDSLAGGISVIADNAASLSEGKGGALLLIRSLTVNGGVLVVHFLIQDDLSGLVYGRKDQRLAFVGPVGSHTKELFVGVGVLLEGLVKSKDGVGGGSLDTSPAAGGEGSDGGTVDSLSDFSEHSFLV